MQFLSSSFSRMVLARRIMSVSSSRCINEAYSFVSMSSLFDSDSYTGCTRRMQEMIKGVKVIL